MVLIGDPKQAIYAFRGGDVVTYLAAAKTATTRATLGTNRRSDAALVERLQAVLAGRRPGRRAASWCATSTAASTARRLGRRALARAVPASAQVRRGDGFALAKGKRACPPDAARAHIAPRLRRRHRRACSPPRRRWDGGPIAGRATSRCSSASGRRPRSVRSALRRARRGARRCAGGRAPSCSTSPAGDEWLCLLEALEQPHRAGRVRAAALTSFLGLTLAELDRGGEALTDEIADRLRGWALLVRGRGVAALFEATEEQGLTARVLGTDRRRERLLTDLRHVAQTLHETAPSAAGLGLTGLLEWLRAERENASQERVRRLDSDAAAVQITTVHQSKGLQYPVVHLPFALDEVRLAGRRRALPRRCRRHAHARRRPVAVPPGRAARRGPSPRGGGRGAARPLRRADARPVAGRHLVGAHREHPARRTPTAALRTPAGPDRGAPTSSAVHDDDYAASRARRCSAELGGPRPRTPRSADRGNAPGAAAEAPGAPGGPCLRPRGGHRVAPHVVLRADPGAGATGGCDVRPGGLAAR